MQVIGREFDFPVIGQRLLQRGKGRGGVGVEAVVAAGAVEADGEAVLSAKAVEQRKAQIGLRAFGAVVLVIKTGGELEGGGQIGLDHPVQHIFLLAVIVDEAVAFVVHGHQTAAHIACSVQWRRDV